MARLALALSVLFGLSGLMSGQALSDEWRAAVLSNVPSSMFSERCERPPQGLPDGCVARSTGTVTRAWYDAPTTRYAHAILGDAIEAGRLVVEADGRTLSLDLPQDQVFEDRTPRFADLDGDGLTEIITIRASLQLGGSVAIFGVRDGAITELGATPYIGRANRWLNIAGIADFLGEGSLQVAFVETPHIGGTLKLASFDGRSVSIRAEQGNFSNHEIRSPEMRLSAIADIDGDGRPDLALPDARRTAMRLVRFEAGAVQPIAQVALPAPVTRAIIAEGTGASVRFLTALADGQVVEISR